MVLVVYAALQRNSIRALLFGTFAGLAFLNTFSATAVGANLLVAPLLAYGLDPSLRGTGYGVIELAKPGANPDLVLGKADAPVTIYEYASMTCSHCATFYRDTMPQVKQKLVEPGTVRFGGAIPGKDALR